MKLAIIGASYLQNPLILKAREMGVETHVFAWAVGDVGEKTADYFYPISIVEKEQILEKCQEIGIDGITTIASDLATVAVGYVANRMGLVANTPECIEKSTNKELMRHAFFENGDPSPRSFRATEASDFDASGLQYPVIVKPSDRSGSRGITKLYEPSGLKQAIEIAIDESFNNVALVEEFAEGIEYSVEFISWQGEHRFITITEKFTSGAPHFIERGHLEPARLSDETVVRVIAVISHALDSLGVEYGASHSEIKIDVKGNIRIIEIGARMGGDFIGSDLVQLSTGYDFCRAVIDVALGREPEKPLGACGNYAAVRFVFDNEDVEVFKRLANDDNVKLIDADVRESFDHEVTDSSSRFGYFLFAGDALEKVEAYLPTHDGEAD